MRIEFGFGVGFDRHNRVIDWATLKAAERAIMLKAAELFGGFNLTYGQGGWINPAGDLVLEASCVLVVDTSSRGGEFDSDATARINQLAEFIREKLNQQAVHVTQLVATSRNVFAAA